jgi:hypothetical protein
MFNFTDFYIIDQTDPSYTANQVIEDDVIRVILQKYKMILFTNKGDVMADPSFGGDLELLVNQTAVSSSYVETQLNNQIGLYIPELSNMNYTLNVVFTQDNVNFYDMMFIYFKLSDYEVYAQFGKSIT